MKKIPRSANRQIVRVIKSKVKRESMFRIILVSDDPHTIYPRGWVVHDTKHLAGAEVDIYHMIPRFTEEIKEPSSLITAGGSPVMMSTLVYHYHYSHSRMFVPPTLARSTQSEKGA